jgi:peptidyl-prolyl cis-trans isomerase SurA
MRRFAIVVLTLLLGAAAASGETLNKIVATIDGDPVTQFELDKFRDQQHARAATAGVDAAAEPTDQKALLDELVLEKIIDKQIKSQGLTASEQQVDNYIANIRGRNNLNDAQLRAALAQQGMTWDQYRAQVKGDIERASLINREIRAKVNVSPEEIERYYNAHIDQYGKPASVKARLISLLVPADATADQKAEIKDKAEQLREQAADGKDFAELAKKNSQGPGAEEGGDIGEIARGQMIKEFEDAAFSLKPGQVSKVIETDTGYHILKVEQQAGDSHRDLKEVSDDIREQLYKENMEERYDRWLKQDLRARHHVEIML